jgi:hypothetical protein
VRRSRGDVWDRSLDGVVSDHDDVGGDRGLTEVGSDPPPPPVRHPPSERVGRCRQGGSAICSHRPTRPAGGSPRVVGPAALRRIGHPRGPAGAPRHCVAVLERGIGFGGAALRPGGLDGSRPGGRLCDLQGPFRSDGGWGGIGAASGSDTGGTAVTPGTACRSVSLPPWAGEAIGSPRVVQMPLETCRMGGAGRLSAGGGSAAEATDRRGDARESPRQTVFEGRKRPATAFGAEVSGGSTRETWAGGVTASAVRHQCPGAPWTRRHQCPGAPRSAAPCPPHPISRAAPVLLSGITLMDRASGGPTEAIGAGMGGGAAHVRRLCGDRAAHTAVRRWSDGSSGMPVIRSMGP